MPAYLSTVPAPEGAVAIKVQRRKYARDGLNEISLHRRIPRDQPGGRYIVRLIEPLFHDGHVCQVYELHGLEAGALLKLSGPMPLSDVKCLARQILEALNLLHTHGLVHTDVKPRNLLWCARQREARLIDLGNSHEVIEVGKAISTWEYSPPEMLVGNPMAAPVDLWSLGCTIFELLTGKLLFDPWKICHEKYEEFEDDGEPSGPSEDELAEQREQLEPGTVLGGKYRLTRVLGHGKVSTVWEAETLHARPLETPLLSREEAREIERAAHKPRPAKEGLDIFKVAVDYEHFVLMQQRFGPFPPELARPGKFHQILYDDTGALRFHPPLHPVPLRETLVEHRFDPDEAAAIEAFLEPMMRFEPAQRPTASEALRSAWLRD